jgi:hypothetical protein
MVMRKEHPVVLCTSTTDEDDEDSELHQPKERVGRTNSSVGSVGALDGTRMDSWDHIYHLNISMQYSIEVKIEGI